LGRGIGRSRTGSGKRNPLPRIELLELNYENFGVTDEEFNWLFSKINPILKKARKVGKRARNKCISNESRLKLALYWMKNACKFRELAFIFGVTKSFVSRDLRVVLLALFITLDEIKMPDTPVNLFTVLGAFGSIDCTHHIRNRQNPGQNLLWRFDLKCHSLTVQLVASHEGIPMRVDIGLGHNNDAGMLNLTGLSQWISDNNEFLFADRGYHHPNLITPTSNDSTDNILWNNRHYGIRSAVETVFKRVKDFQIAGSTPFRQSVAFQRIVLMVIYQLVAKKLKETPLRTPMWYANQIIDHN